MRFAGPMWLTLLLPWAALAIWLLWSHLRGTPARVPFVDLWRGPVEPQRSSRRFALPPLAIVALLAAMLLAILGAAHPQLPRSEAISATIVIDRGITMSAGTRRLEVLDMARRLLPADASVRFITVPEAEVSTWAPVENLPPTCVDTSAALQRAVSHALATTSDAVVVLSDQAVRDDARMVRIVPTTTVANAGITRFALREHPTTQAMITIRNDTAASRASLVVDTTRQTIDLPPAGQEISYFIGLPAAGRALEARLEVADDFEADNVAYLARQRAFPKIELRGNLPAEVRRVIEAYRAARPPSEQSATVHVVPSIDMLADNEAGVIAPRAASRIESPPTLRPHAITANLDVSTWSNLTSAPAPTTAGWTPIILSANNALLSVSDKPARQVWLGFTSENLPHTTQFVILWTNILDWISDSSRTSDAFTAVEVGQVAPEFKPQSGRELWPGFYQRSDGAVIAANAPPAQFPAAASSAQRERNPAAQLASATFSQSRAVDLSRYFFVAACAGALIAATLWPR